uniref:Solute carrier family 49 member 4-like n=1 Tax=Actinia tenebrosa TaxID=6105 RepID=A0A6P8HA50_ACTTE
MNHQNENSPLIPTVTVKSKHSSVNNIDDNHSYSNSSISRFKIYKRRWYILSMYTVIALTCNLDWNTWGPISQACKILFGWGNWQVLFLTSWSAISIIVSAIPSTWVMNEKGLRKSVILCTFLLTAGKAFQVIPSSDPLTRTILLNIGQCISMLSTPVGLGAPPSISATWFPPKERTTATAISTLFAYLGVACAFVVGPYLVPITKRVHIGSVDVAFTNHTVYDIETMTTNLSEYMGIQLGISALLLVCVLVYFPDKPPLPPCATSSSRQHSYVTSVKKLVVNGPYLYLGLIFAMSYGVYAGWMAVLSLAVKPFGIDEYLSGWLGCAAVVAGILSGVCLARVVDYIKSHTKTVLILLFLGTTISQLLFTLTCSKIIPFSKPLLFSSIIFGGLFFNVTTPLMFEMAVETVYPIAEGLTAILLLCIGYSVYLIIIITFMFPVMNVKWINWATVILNGLCVPGLMVYKNKFRRLDLE